MNYLHRIFKRNKIVCPRCEGKGHVDFKDIQRLKKEIFWQPGKCAYCEGTGNVPADMLKKVSPDLEYLTTDLPNWERNKLLTGDKEALLRANEFTEFYNSMMAEIEHLYYIENKEPDAIATDFLERQTGVVFTDSEKQELIDYIEKVIKSKLNK